MIGIIVIGFVTLGVHNKNVNTKYPITNHSEDIQQNLTIWQNRGEEYELHPDLIKVEHLGKSDTYVAFFENKPGELGIAILKEGPNKKLQIRSTQYGSREEEHYATYYGVHTNKGNYGILIGKNSGKQIHSIRAELENSQLEFLVPVPEDNKFILIKKLPKGISSLDYADLYHLDKDNKEIQA